MKKNMTIVLAPDSFKESMTAKEVCEAMEKGIKKANPNIKCIKVPMADGGEGTMQSLVDATDGKVYKVKVQGPLGAEVEAEYGILGDGEVAVIEMASASGIHLVPKEKRNPMKTSTFGTGQLIKACLEHSIKKLLIGIGGSATNDGGAGMVQALGGKLLDSDGNELPLGGGELRKLAQIDLSNLDDRLKDVEVEVACDVNNPLVGEKGASYVFGPQKGATEEMVKVLDENLRHYGVKIKECLGIDIVEVPGAGAAGGLGAGLMAFLNGTLKNGLEMVVEYTKLEQKVKEADMVWTGEGSIDHQTIYGKTPYGVARVAKKYKLPVIALAGRIGDGIEPLYDSGIDAIYSIMQGVSSLEDALINGRRNVKKTSENVARLIDIIY
ncbi:MAG: glycerate 2-kinase [Candidatus Petromonas sp.]|jgi:glycerate kinase|nr:glycerate 2-kinase [Candidatus Petromonas sp.]